MVGLFVRTHYAQEGQGDVACFSLAVPSSMARFASAFLLAAVLLMARRLTTTHAGPSTAEVFWRAVLPPGSAVPDAVLRQLRLGFAGEASADDTGRSNAPFNYQNYKRPSATAPPGDRTDGVAGGGLGARDDTPFGYDYVAAPSQGGVAAAGNGGGARDDTPFGYDYVAAPTQAAVAAGSGATPPTAVFFHEDAVRVGERLPLHFRAAAAPALGLLPRRVADAIPFTRAALPAVLALLGVPPGSPRAAAMAETLRACETPPVAGEAKFCATSLEALVERAVAALGTRDVRAVTSALPRAGLPPQPYTVRAVRRVVSGSGSGSGRGFVACHDEAYPYTVYRCHGTGPARAYLVEMEGARAGGVVTVATVCHTDTSRWNPEHASFKLLGTRPGGEPVCHLMPYGHIIWAKNVNRSPA